jgi:thioredoxin reductase (NADPH)
MGEEIYDVVIIGAGPAGLTAAIYTAREDIKTLVLEKGVSGGLASLADLIENYPGFSKGISGIELVGKFKDQAEKFGAKIIEFTEVQNLDILSEYMVVKTGGIDYKTRSIIVATGTVPKRLNIPGEERLSAKGVSYCATCDGPLFRNKKIFVVGGGDTAVKGANFLSKFADKVILVHRRDELRASPAEQKKILNNPKIDVLWSHRILSIEGKQKVERLVLKDLKTDKERSDTAEGVFIFAGYIPHSDFLEGVLDIDDAGYIKTDKDMSCSKRGIFSAGDIRQKKVRQVVTACGDGTVAAMSVRDYLQSIEKKFPPEADPPLAEEGRS